MKISAVSTGKGRRCYDREKVFHIPRILDLKDEKNRI